MEKKKLIFIFMVLICFLSLASWFHLYRYPVDKQVANDLHGLLVKNVSIDLIQVFNGAETICFIPYYVSAEPIRLLIGEKNYHRTETIRKINLMIGLSDHSWLILVERKNEWSEYRMAGSVIPAFKKAVCTKNTTIKRSNVEQVGSKIFLSFELETTKAE